MSDNDTLPAPPPPDSGTQLADLDERFAAILQRLQLIKLPTEMNPKRDILLVEEGAQEVVVSRRDSLVERYGDAFKATGWLESVNDLLVVIAKSKEISIGGMPVLVIVQREMRLAWLLCADPPKPERRVKLTGHDRDRN